MNRRKLMQPSVHLSLQVSEDLLPRFCLLAGGGFTFLVQTGCTVHDLLCGQLGIPAEYLVGRVQTIFLNASVVDDSRTASVPAGATIALSAAMPGIAGIMLRKGSPYAPMRSRISHVNRDSTGQAPRRDHVVLKLFNMLQRELGPPMLRRGVQVSGRALADLFRGRTRVFHRGILSARFDEEPISPDVLLETDWTGRDVFLRMQTRQHEETELYDPRRGA
ncbi:MAG: hypothetical protein JXB62_17555 [Pirellulales bacterium]|nr:hypothetical protein [Pirellulales bacterium]